MKESRLHKSILSHFLILLTASVFSLSLHAQGNALEREAGASTGSLEKSNSVNLESVCSSLSSRPLMTGDFLQEKTISKAGRSLISSGIFIFSEEGILWKTQKPFASAMAVTLDSIIQTRADGKKTVTDAKGNQIFLSISKSLSALFRGNQKELLENFIVDFSYEEGSSSLLFWKIHLTPKDKVVQGILGSIDVCGKIENYKKNMDPEEIQTKIDSIFMKETSGDSIRYTFSNHKFPERLTEDEKNYFSVQ
ncbi:MAG: outer membrane lipoprotein carrier protein LolA [Treponema sp.]|nr:outer membrane lipoprotein carrier protein LolA [Treponema sp.]